MLGWQTLTEGDPFSYPSAGLTLVRVPTLLAVARLVTAVQNTAAAVETDVSNPVSEYRGYQWKLMRVRGSRSPGSLPTELIEYHC